MVTDSFETVTTLYQRVKDHDVEIVETVDHGITRSVYFKDPDGNELEIYCEVVLELYTPVHHPLNDRA